MTPDEYATEAGLHADMADRIAEQADELEQTDKGALGHLIDLFYTTAEWHRLRHDYLLLLGAISAHREAALLSMPDDDSTFWQGDLTLWEIVDADDRWRENLLADDDSDRVEVPPSDWPGWN